MSEHYYRVGVHGPPNPDEHPWVMLETTPGTWESVRPAEVRWVDPDVWMPWEPPSELAPEPEDQGVEVSGFRYRINADGYLQKHTQFGWVLSEYREVLADELAYLARIAAALGLVDQPPVPRALIDWLREKAECQKRERRGSPFHDGAYVAFDRVRGAIEAGEFGPVEGERPSTKDIEDALAPLIIHGPGDDPHSMGDLNCPQCGVEGER